MPEVQIRPAVATDIPIVSAIDHSCQTEYVWQMDLQREEGQFGAVFRMIRLPHPVKQPYPRSISDLADSWNRRSGMLVGLIGGKVIGYIRMSDTFVPGTAWITDLVVAPNCRRQGVATALILATQSWGRDRNNNRALMEMSSKNHAAVCLARKLDYEFCGYNDLYYETQDIALFFGRSIR